MNKELDQIIAEQKKIADDRTAEILRPITEDIERGYLAPLSICDGCGREDQPCKVYPINSQSNAILCRSCFTKEENALRMSYRKEDTTAWYKLNWYGLN